MTIIDLKEEHLITVKTILSKHIPDCEVWAFGSRVNGRAKKYSDLDLAIISKTPLPPTTMALLREDFSESNLPIKIDLIDWSATTEEFRKIILQKFVKVM